MAGDEQSREERIRALIEEVDRVRSESERIRSHVDPARKRPFWPERRRDPRIPTSSERRGRDEDS